MDPHPCLHTFFSLTTHLPLAPLLSPAQPSSSLLSLLRKNPSSPERRKNSPLLLNTNTTPTVEELKETPPFRQALVSFSDLVVPTLILNGKGYTAAHIPSQEKKSKDDGDPCRSLKFCAEDLESYSDALVSLPHEVGAGANTTEKSATPAD